MFRLGLTVAGFIYKMSWKAVQKAYPKVSKTVFNQIKRYKNKKNLKDAFDKVEKKKIITKKKPDIVTKKPDIITKKKHKVEYKKKTTTTTKPVKKGITATTAANLGKEVKNLASIVNKLTLGVVPATGRQFVKAPLKTTAITAGAGYAIPKAIDIGKKMFSGGQIETGVKTTDIKNEITGNGTETKGPPLSGGATGLNNFVNAHNEALATGQDYFVFEGKHYNVGKTQLSQF